MVSRSECSSHRGSLQLVTDAERKTDKWPEAEGRTEQREAVSKISIQKKAYFGHAALAFQLKSWGLRKIYGAQHPAKIPSHNLTRYFKYIALSFGNCYRLIKFRMKGGFTTEFSIHGTFRLMQIPLRYRLCMHRFLH